MIESESGLSYSFHLGNDKNKTKKARQSAKNNSSNITSFSNNAIQNIKQLGKVNHHNLRKYDNNRELIKIIKGTNDIVKDVKDLYKQEFEELRIEYNNKQTREDRKIKDNIYPTRTYLNGEEVSNIFDVDGPDKLYRIFDLYNGIINPRNETDINSINLGFLSQDAFNFKELKGISEQEDSLVGTPLVNVDDTYVNYLKEFFDSKFGYKGSIGFDRNSMLLGIKYQMLGPERAKREIERKLGIPYSEFEQLDFDEQQKLIELKTGKKFKYDYRLHIDGIPMDEEHIITREQIDRQIDELTLSKPKIFLKRLLKPFDKK